MFRRPTSTTALPPARPRWRREHRQILTAAILTAIGGAVDIAVGHGRFLGALSGLSGALLGSGYLRLRAERAVRELPSGWTAGQLVLLRRGPSRVPYLVGGPDGGVPVRTLLGSRRSPPTLGQVWYRGEMRGRRAVLVVATPSRVRPVRAAAALPRGRFHVEA